MEYPNTGATNETETVQSTVRIAIATYLVGCMIDSPTRSTPQESAKKRKVKAAFEYADLILKG